MEQHYYVDLEPQILLFNICVNGCFYCYTDCTNLHATSQENIALKLNYFQVIALRLMFDDYADAYSKFTFLQLRDLILEFQHCLFNIHHVSYLEQKIKWYGQIWYLFEAEIIQYFHHSNGKRFKCNNICLPLYWSSLTSFQLWIHSEGVALNSLRGP